MRRGRVLSLGLAPLFAPWKLTMSSPFTQAGVGLLAAIDAVAGETIVYSRPSTAQSVNLVATPGLTRHEDIDANGFPIITRSKDWMFPAADLKLDGVNAVEPERDDEIRWIDDGGDTHVFRVLPFGTVRAEWRFSDGGQTRFRVHTKRIDIE